MACEQAGITVYLPKPMISGLLAKGRFGKQDFVYVAADDVRRRAAVPLGLSLFAIGKPLEARSALEEAVRTYSELKGGPVSAISEALSLIEETGESHVVSEVYRIRGDLLVDAKRGDSEVDYLKALELARLQGARLFELRAAMSLARLWTDQHKRTEARNLLTPIYDWFGVAAFTRFASEGWWACLDSSQEPDGYERLKPAVGWLKKSTIVAF